MTSSEIRELFPDSILPEVLDFLGGEGERFLDLFAGMKIAVPSAAEVRARRQAVAIAQAVRRHKLGEIDDQGLAEIARANGEPNWMRIFFVAKRGEAILAQLAGEEPAR